MQNCPIFNDKTHEDFAAKEVREEKTIMLQHGEPMIFGKNRDKGLALDGTTIKVVKKNKNGVTEKDILVHNAHEKDPSMHMQLAAMKAPDFPVAFGVIRAVEDDTYDDKLHRQTAQVVSARTITNMSELLHSGETWRVE
jgi:2-oxoglutarate ferredoxin oxidoreductase subunit beta